MKILKFVWNFEIHLVILALNNLVQSVFINLKFIQHEINNNKVHRYKKYVTVLSENRRLRHENTVFMLLGIVFMRLGVNF